MCGSASHTNRKSKNCHLNVNSPFINTSTQNCSLNNKSPSIKNSTQNNFQVTLTFFVLNISISLLVFKSPIKQLISSLNLNTYNHLNELTPLNELTMSFATEYFRTNFRSIMSNNRMHMWFC